MKKKKGRPPKQHKYVPTSFDEVLGAVADSEYTDEPTIKDRRGKKRN